MMQFDSNTSRYSEISELGFEELKGGYYKLNNIILSFELVDYMPQDLWADMIRVAKTQTDDELASIIPRIRAVDTYIKNWIKFSSEFRKVEKKIKGLFNGYKYHSIKPDDYDNMLARWNKIVIRFNDMSTFNMGALILETNNIDHKLDEQNANITVEVSYTS